MGTRHLYWILTGPSFAVYLLPTEQVMDKLTDHMQGEWAREDQRCKLGEDQQGSQLL